MYNLNVNQIRMMPLIDRQKLVVDLRINIKRGDKFYETAQGLIIAATSKDWKEPALMEVKNVAGHDLTIDNIKIAKDEVGKVYHWQYVACSRFLEATNPDDSAAAIKSHVRQPEPSEHGRAPTSDDQIESVVIKLLAKHGIKTASS